MPTNVALTGLAKDLAARQAAGKPIRIGLAGSGEMGTDIVTRVAHMQGIEVGAVVDQETYGIAVGDTVCRRFQQ